jgi:hypothetical protein
MLGDVAASYVKSLVVCVRCTVHRETVKKKLYRPFIKNLIHEGLE